MSQLLLDKAIAAHRQGDLEIAEALYRSFLLDNPKHADALALFGLLCGDVGQTQEALQSIQQAIALDPQAALFKFYFGNILLTSGQTTQAINVFREAIELQPDLPVLHYNLANALRKDQQDELAIQSYKNTLEHDPNHAEARNNLALLYQNNNQTSDALKELKLVVQLHPTYAQGWLNLSKIAGELYESELSLKAGQHAVELLPTDASAHHALGTAFTRLQRHPEAEQSYLAAITLRPNWCDTWDNLGLTYQFMGRLDEAEAAFRKVIELADQVISDDQVRLIDERDFGTRHWHLSQLELSKGDYWKGWGRYRCRFSAHGGIPRPNFKQTYWRGEDIKGKTILVMDEEGRGDGLMMSRYIPLLKARGAHVKFYVHPTFTELFKGWSGADEIISLGEPLGSFDLYTWVLDLPYCFGTTLETIPLKTPYLPLLTPDTKTQLTTLPDPKKRRIGICWAGSWSQPQYKRQIPLDQLGELLEKYDFEIYSLTRDKRPGDDNLIKKFGFIDLAPLLDNFADLAKFIDQMDVIISCDTAIAHLAGGMGKTIWTCLSFYCDWRWLTQRSDSVWYPTMKLIRQPKTGDWPSVMLQLKNGLDKLVI